MKDVFWRSFVDSNSIAKRRFNDLPAKTFATRVIGEYMMLLASRSLGLWADDGEFATEFFNKAMLFYTSRSFKPIKADDFRSKEKNYLMLALLFAETMDEIPSKRKHFGDLLQDGVFFSTWFEKFQNLAPSPATRFAELLIKRTRDRQNDRMKPPTYVLTFVGGDIVRTFTATYEDFKLDCGDEIESVAEKFKEDAQMDDSVKESLQIIRKFARENGGIAAALQVVGGCLYPTDVGVVRLDESADLSDPDFLKNVVLKFKKGKT